MYCLYWSHVHVFSDSPTLRSLHVQFVDFVTERSIPCLSFGELRKTALGMTLKTLIVPPESSGKNRGIWGWNSFVPKGRKVCLMWPVPKSYAAISYPIYYSMGIPKRVTKSNLDHTSGGEKLIFDKIPNALMAYIQVMVLGVLIMWQTNLDFHLKGKVRPYFVFFSETLFMKNDFSF